MRGENLGSFLINFLKYVIKLLLPESIIKFISQLTSTRYAEDLDPSPKYPVKKISEGLWKYKWFIVKALK
jgi:hypothetical protein